MIATILPILNCALSSIKSLFSGAWIWILLIGGGLCISGYIYVQHLHLALSMLKDEVAIQKIANQANMQELAILKRQNEDNIRALEAVNAKQKNRTVSIAKIKDKAKNEQDGTIAPALTAVLSGLRERTTGSSN